MPWPPKAGRYLAAHPAAAEQRPGDYSAFKAAHFHGDEVVYVSLGEGATSEGEFWEAMSSASSLRLPVLFVIEDNGYAISVPVDVNTPGGNISHLVANFPNFYFAEVDGTDPVESYAAFTAAVQHCRSGKGPAFVHGHVIRQYSHSFSDDEGLYRSEAERKRDAALDPLPKLQMRLLRDGILDPAAINRLEQEVDEEVRAAAEKVLRAPLPEISSIKRHVYSEDLDPTAASEMEPSPPVQDERPDTQGAHHGGPDQRSASRTRRSVIRASWSLARMWQIPATTRSCVTGWSRVRVGSSSSPRGCSESSAPSRKLHGLAEADIVGRAVGMATRGLKPVVEVQFFDYIWPAMHQLRNEVSLLRWRSNGSYSAPMVIRVAIGGYLTGGSVYHSQCGESIFTHTPGIRVVFPSNALDANGLLRTAIRCDDPVLFFEHKRLYRETFGRAVYPGPDFAIPFGKANLLRQGKDITLITYGAVVPRALRAAQQASSDLGLEVDLIDLRTLSPYDWEAIATSVQKTGRVIVAHEDMLSWGYGAEIAARIADELFEYLDAPVKRVAAMDTFVAYQPILEDAILPQPEDLFRALAELGKY